jgi:acyl-CoA thioesterase-1
MIVSFKESGADVVLAGMTLPRNFGPDYIQQFEQIFPSLARKHNLRLIPFFLEDVVLNPDLVLEDGVHPNAQGYRVVTKTVLHHLAPLLRR